MQIAGAVGVTATVVPLKTALAQGHLQSGIVQRPPAWLGAGNKPRFRRDGLPKVTGEKVFAIDIRARDMADWPDDQSHALLVRATRADRRFLDIDLSLLDEDAAPDVVVTQDDLDADGIVMPEADFYGDLLLARGQTPVFLGQPVALLIFHDYARFRLARSALRFTQDHIVYGEETGHIERDPYGASRFVRIGGATPWDEDVFSPLKDGTLFGRIANRAVEWPEAQAEGEMGGRAMAHAKTVREALDAPPGGQRVFTRNYSSQSVDPAAMETDNGNAWYDPASGRLEVVTGTQSPYTNATHIMAMVKASRHDLSAFRLYPGYTVGYGQKEHHSLPYYVAMAALYGEGRPVRLAFDRWEHFQSAIKRHAFAIRTSLAVDEESGLFQALAADLEGDGGGRMNFSPSVGQVAATALQSIYYIPKSDLAATMKASRAPTAGSMRGYGTLQSMTAMEMLVDEIAAELELDPIDLRRRNLLRPGMKNTQGAIPAGALRAGELLDAAAADPLWFSRKERKAAFEAAHPGHLHGVGFACVHKDYGTGAEVAIVQIEISPSGRLMLRHVASEIGCGSTTAQMLLTARHLGRVADDAEFAVIDWPALPLHSSDEPYTMSQEEQDRLAQDPHWVPRLTSPRSASNSAYYFSHATSEAARILFDQGLWKAAVSIWSEGIGGGQAAPLAIRREDAVWQDGRLTLSSLEPLSTAVLAARAHELGFATGVAIHTFNRWAWTKASFEVGDETVEGAIDALSLRWGAGAPEERKARMTDAGFEFIPRKTVSYPPVQRNNAGVVYYAPAATLVELSVNTGTGEVTIINHRSWLECGTPIVPELVSGQLQGGLAMGIGHALFEELPLYEDGPGNGTWNFNRYQLPRASDVAVWRQEGRILEPRSKSDPPKGIAEVVMIPVVAAIANGVAAATGKRIRDLPLRPDRILEALA